jgi:site-specific recombinase XerD
MFDAVVCATGDDRARDATGCVTELVSVRSRTHWMSDFTYRQGNKERLVPIGEEASAWIDSTGSRPPRSLKGRTSARFSERAVDRFRRRFLESAHSTACTTPGRRARMCCVTVATHLLSVAPTASIQMMSAT